jgi:hypothetical protein
VIAKEIAFDELGLLKEVVESSENVRGMIGVRRMSCR